MKVLLQACVASERIFKPNSHWWGAGLGEYTLPAESHSDPQAVQSHVYPTHGQCCPVSSEDLISAYLFVTGKEMGLDSG